MLTFLRKKFVMHADQSFCTFTFTLNLQLQSRQDNHRPRGDTPRMAQTSKFCKEYMYRRYQRTCADCAHRSAGRGARGQRSAPAQRVCSRASVPWRLCVGSHAMLTCRCIRGIRLYPRPSTFDLGGSIGGRAACGACCMERDRTGETTSDRPPRRTVRVRVARRAPTRATVRAPDAWT